MCTAHFPSSGGGMQMPLHYMQTLTPWTETPPLDGDPSPGWRPPPSGCRPLPLDADPFPRFRPNPSDADPLPWLQTPSTWMQTLLHLDANPSPWVQNPPPGHVTCDACWEANSPPLDVCHVTCDACWEANPPSLWQTNTCENITLPQT